MLARSWNCQKSDFYVKAKTITDDLHTHNVFGQFQFFARWCTHPTRYSQDVDDIFEDIEDANEYTDD